MFDQLGALRHPLMVVSATAFPAENGRYAPRTPQRRVPISFRLA